MARPKMVDPDIVPTKENLFPEITKKEDNSTFIEILPSRYALYPEGTKLYGRPLTVKEIKKLTKMNETNYAEIILDILDSAISGYPIEDLYTADKFYLILWLRSMTYKNANFITEYICEHCGAKQSYHFDVDVFEVRSLPEDYDPNFELTLLNCKDKIRIKFMQVSDENRVAIFKESVKTSRAVFDDDTIKLAAIIESINDQTQTLRTVYEYLDRLDAEDLQYISSYIREMDFGVIPVVNATCTMPKCRGENELPITFQSEFFAPKYKFR